MVPNGHGDSSLGKVQAKASTVDSKTVSKEQGSRLQLSDYYSVVDTLDSSLVNTLDNKEIHLRLSDDSSLVNTLVMFNYVYHGEDPSM